MNKQSYITNLKRELGPLKQSTKLEILADIEEHFQNGKASGKTEEQVAQELGSVNDLAAQYVFQAEENEKVGLSPNAIGRSVLAAIGLFLLDILIMIPIIASLFAVVISLWTIPISLLAASIGLIILPLLSFVTYVIPFWICLIIAISLTALAVAISIGLVYVTKYFFMMVASYARAHYKIIKGGLKNE
jgi:uncharacterized membrane protein